MAAERFGNRKLVVVVVGSVLEFVGDGVDPMNAKKITKEFGLDINVSPQRETWNKLRTTLPVKFSLGGDKGMDIFALPPTVAPASKPAVGRLVYNPWSAQYSFIWKTDKAWKNTTQTLTMTLVDGTTHTVEVLFR